MKTNDENLIPTSQRTPTEAREMGRKGGKASGAARRRKASLKAAVKGVLQDDPDILTDIAAAIIRKAKDGDPKSVKIVQDLLGETVQHDELRFREKQYNEAKKSGISADPSMLYAALMAAPEQAEEKTECENGVDE